MGDEGWRLFNCEMYLDGGSLGAVLAQGDSFVSLFLKARGPNLAPDVRYKSLFVSTGRDPAAREREVPREEEKLWLERLAACDLALSELEGLERFPGDMDRPGNARMRWRELVAILRERQGQP